MASDETKAKRVGEVSPEGRPAKPNAGVKTIVVASLFIALLVVIVAIVLAITVSPTVGLGVGIAGLMIGIVSNIAIWVSLLRVRERQRVADDDPGPTVR